MIVLVQIIGAPVACAEGINDSWRIAAAWAGQKLAERFGDALKFEYFDLFDPACPVFPGNSQIPIVLINGALFSSGGKIPIPAIRRHLETLGLKSLI